MSQAPFSPPFSPPLLLVTDRKRFPPPRSGEVFAAAEWAALSSALEGGVGAIQLREKDLDGGALLARASRLVAACREAGARLVVNDRVDVALAAGADGVHLPGDGITVGDARRLAGASALVGRSIHDPAELAAAADADYVLFGPVFETPSKRRYGAPQGTERLAAVARAAAAHDRTDAALAARSPPPALLAIGGLVPERVAEVVACGAVGVAVMGAVLSAASPAMVVRSFRAALASARSSELSFPKSGW